MQAKTFDVIERRKSIIFFKLGKLWVFKQFFDNRVIYNALLDYYSKDLYRFEFKSIGARNNALKLLERNGFDYDLVEDLAAVEEAVGLGAKIVEGEVAL